MTDNWGFYERRSKSEQLRILVNVGYKESAPPGNYDMLVSVTVNLYPVREQNRSKADFVKQLERFESGLEQWLKGSADAVYIGRINASTRLEFYYYVQSGRLTEADLERWVKEHWEYRAQLYMKHDEDWSHYRFMLPDQLEELFMHNAQMIYTLVHKGDNIKRPRNVYHWLLFREDEERRQVEMKLQNLGYRIEKEKEGYPDPGYPFPLVISKYEDVTLDTVNNRVRELYRLMSGHGGRYDGWGSVMRVSPSHRFRQSIRKLLDSACFLTRNKDGGV